MNFDYFKDNQRLIRRLNESVLTGNVSHAYILEGDTWLDKRKFADSFAKGILCPDGRGENCGRCSMCAKIDNGNCEDIIYVEPEKSGNVKNESIILMQEQLKTKPFGSRHIAVVDKADTMTDRAQNRLLKTLEEPPGDTVIILLSENMENLTQTIRSRCVKFHINHLGGESYDFMMDTASRLIDMVSNHGTFYELTKEISSIYKDKEKVCALLDSMEVVYRDMLVNGADKIITLKTDDIVNNIHLVEDAARDVRIGVSPATAIKNLLIKIGGVR
ncbi:MAG: hypothetical protein PUI82_06275 [Firmicutes bacterium]|nr:hypothetical protein [Bacillota bacterium]MDY4959099.1 hypothetical protein [Lentihominibacter sp.]